MKHQKAALVTGSAIRLGKAIAIALAQSGFDIALHYYSSSDKAAETQAEIRAIGVACELFPQDLADASSLETFVGQVKEKMPHLSVLVNSASAYTSGEIESTSVDMFDQQFSINLRAPFFLSKGFAKHCQSGHIINICDNKIAYNQYAYAAYLLSKKALAEFVKIAALEFAPNIRVNGVAPGVVLPADTRSDDYINWRIQGIPLQKQGTTKNITSAVVHLVDNDFMTGQVLMVDGGEAIAHIGRNATQYKADK
ncbi:MAG: SDR family oxidoreductase [Cyanobacteria bacterium P01_F01_bin.150]